MFAAVVFFCLNMAKVNMYHIHVIYYRKCYILHNWDEGTESGFRKYVIKQVLEGICDVYFV
jgi:hypothetical protein